MNCCIVIGSMNVTRKIIKEEGDFLVAADKGYLNCLKQNLDVDLLIGDFDSLKIIPNNIETVRLNKIKDDTDTFDAIKEGISRGYKSFKIYGVIGGRFEHSFANLSILLYLVNRGYDAKIYSNKKTYILLKNGDLALKKKKRGYLSVFSITDKCYGVTLKNLKYELNNKTLYKDIPLGIDNEYINQEPFISVKEGTLLIIY